MENIKSERVRAGMTQQDLANHLDVGIATVKRWELGTVEPRGSHLIEMSKLFGCSTDYLLGETEERL